MEELDKKLPNGIYRTYERMTQQPLYNPEDNTWHGTAADIAAALNLSVYSIYQSFAALKSLGCIEKLVNGSKHGDSIFKIIKPPTNHEYQLGLERSLIFGKLTQPSQSARAQDSITRLTNRVNDLERRLERLESGFDIR